MTHFMQALVAAILIAVTACGQASSSEAARAKPEPGTYTSVTISVGTRFGMSYNGTQGFTLQAMPQVSPAASPLGVLVLQPDGRYEMPDVNYTGHWTFLPDEQALTFTGALAGVKNTCRVSQGAYLVTFEFETSDGEPMLVEYRKPADHPIPDLARPNGDFTGQLILFDGDASDVLDIASGKIVRSFESGAAGWPNAAGETVHVHDEDIHSPRNAIHVELRDPSGSLRARFSGAGPDGDPWSVKDYWFGEMSPSGDEFLVFGTRTVFRGMNGGFYGNLPSDPVSTPTAAVINADGNERFFFESAGKFAPTWLDGDNILYADESGGVSLINVTSQSRQAILPGEIDVAIARPDGKSIVYLQADRLKLFDLGSQRSTTVLANGVEFDLTNLNVRSMRWSPDGQIVALSIGGVPTTSNFLVLVSVRDGTVVILLSAQGDPVSTPSAIFGWTG